MLSFVDFKRNCLRKDSSINNKLHFFSKNFSVRLAYILYSFGFSPDFTTLIFGLCGVISAISFFYDFKIAGYILWRLHILFDMADGNIARATNNFNPDAKLTDKFTHIVVNILVISCLFLGDKTFLQNENNIKLFVSLLPIYVIYFLFDSFTISYGLDLRNKLPSNKFFIILKNLCTQEGLLLVIFFISIFPKFNNGNYFYILVFYNLSFLFAVLYKLYFLKISKKVLKD